MNSRILKSAGTLVLLLTALSALLLTGCESKSTADDSPSGMTISVSASPSTLATGNTTVVEATVRNGGSPVADQVVMFAAAGAGDGYFTPASDTTDASGVAAAVFTATSSGSVTVSAGVQGTSLTSTVGLSIQSSSEGSGNINVTVTPSLLLANGSDTAAVTIAVRDALGQPAPDETVVKLAAGEKFVDLDENGYWSPGIDSLVFDANANGQWDAFGLIPSTVQTSGGTGNATVNYISGSDALTVYIKVTVDDNGITGTRDVQVQLTPDASISSLFLSSDSMQLSVKQTGGIETSWLRAVGYDGNGNPVPEGLTVNFVITDGPGGGEHLGNVGYGPYTAVTNSQGVASCPISSGTVSGTVRIRAYADTVLSNATQILISAGPPQYIVVGAEECNVPYWNTVAFENPVVAVVSDIYLNPVNDSTVVYFSTDEGTMKSHEERTMDHEGIAKSVWFSGNNVATADGRVWIYAETAGGTVLDSSLFFNSWHTDTLIVTGVPASIFADGNTEYVVYVVGLDVNGNPVDDGTTFDGEGLYVDVTGGTLSDGCVTASARVKVKSQTLDMDYSTTGGNDNGIGAVGLVQYWAFGSSVTSIPVTIQTGNAYSGTSVLSGVSSAAPGEVVNLSASIKDRWGNPLGDHTLNMTASGGAVSGASQETDAYGEANGFVWTAPAGAGDYTITVTDTDPRGGIILSTTVTVE
ncbi:MAG: hypothetical protein RBT76_05995 [candidate division Zixibacteria bacterium]|jgi:adhesin/invasin|nr:hypothetical protein [candidate division Zixibacteria bacterium]